jgi:hypothetical protein
VTDGRDDRNAERPIAIPDGGLTSSLPAWMQAKPDWSGREGFTEDIRVVTDRVLPQPETGPIDLAAILSTEDVPAWLQSIALRRDNAQEILEETTELHPVPSSTRDDHPDRDQPVALSNGAQPWWASDRVMAGLLIAVIITLFFVLVTTARLL